jgi:membrane-associated phospholipid phosphatase
LDTGEGVLVLQAGYYAQLVGMPVLSQRQRTVTPAIVMPVMIAAARLYRGEHHPTDLLASLLFAALWLTAATMLIKPNEDAFRRGRIPQSLRRRKPADRTEETSPAAA